MSNATIKLYDPTVLNTCDKTCLKYSDNPEQLRELLNKLSITVELKRPEQSKHSEEKWLLCLPVEVTIKKGDKSITFDRYASHNEAIPYCSKDDYLKITGNKLYYKSVYMRRFGRDIYDDCFKLGNKVSKAKKEFLNNLKYSILASVQCEYFIEPIFEDFCADFGYEEDSRKAFDTWQTCLKHSQKLQQIFTSEDVECLPC